MRRFAFFAFCLCAAVLAVAFLACCGEGAGRRQAADAVAADSIVPAAGDSTIYGVCGESGMSTFCLISDDGDTLYFNRETQDGRYGEFFGDVVEGDRFALTTRRDGPAERAVAVAINVSQVERFTRQFSVANGRLVLNYGERHDTVGIDWLDSDSLVVRLASGRRVVLLPR